LQGAEHSDTAEQQVQNNLALLKQHCHIPFWGQTHKLATQLQLVAMKRQLLKLSIRNGLVQLLSCLSTSAALTGQNFLQPSYIINTFLLPNYCRIHRNYNEYPGRWRQYVPLKCQTFNHFHILETQKTTHK